MNPALNKPYFKACRVEPISLGPGKQLGGISGHWQ
jgi:hypothetical protein